MSVAGLVRRVGRLLVSVGALAMAGAASASWVTPMGATTVEYVSGGVRITDGTGGWQMQSRSWANPSGRTIGVAEVLNGQVGGRGLSVTASRMLSPTAILGAASRCLGNPICMAVTAGGAAVIADHFGTARVSAGEGGGLLQDPGIGPISDYAWAMGNSLASWQASPYRGSTAEAAHSSYVSAMCTAWLSQPSCGPNCSYVCTSVALSCGGSDYVKGCSGGKTRQQLSGSTVVADSQISGTYYRNDAVGAPMGEYCPASVDASNPAYSIPAGSPVGPDGKCPTARYNHVPLPIADAPALVEARSPPDAAKLEAMAKESLSKGESIEATGERELSGPSSVSGGSPSVTTETKPDGTVITTTKTPTITYNYNGNTVTYTTTYTTTIHNSTTNETTTINEGTPGDQTDPESECVKNPDALGCVKLGTAPDEAPEWQTIDVPFAAEDLGFSGACPAPVSWSVFGMTLEWSYQAVCDVAPMIRVALLLMASIGAIGIVFKETSA